MSLEQRTVARIAREFSPPEQSSVIELLSSYSGPESGRVVWDILELSKGNLESVSQHLQAAQKDYRDVLYWAEFASDDPLMRGRDPRQMVNDIIAKVGRQEMRPQTVWINSAFQLDQQPSGGVHTL